MKAITIILSMVLSATLAKAADTYLYPEEGSPVTAEGAHLFILSGQSNMARLDPSVSFTPAVCSEFGDDSVVVVKEAKGSQPMSQWYKEWKSVKGREASEKGLIYDRLMLKVQEAIKGRTVKSVTFLWMQGENDANRREVDVYENALDGLMLQLQTDLGQEGINLVIGRLSDANIGEGNPKRESWLKMRALQQRYAEESASRAWVSTDDLNNMLDRKTGEPRDDVHYTREGYKLFGQRLADEAIKLVKGN